MPVMDGFEAAKLIREHEKKHGMSRTPILALTADYVNETRVKCFEAGMDGFLTKPIDFERLYNKLINLTNDGIDNDSKDKDDMFDFSRIAELKKLQLPGKADIVSQLFDMYLKEAGLKIEKLKKAAGDGDAGSLRMIAHNLKSSTLSVGGVRLSALFKALENKAKNNDLNDIEAFIEKIDENYKRLEEKLKQMLENKEYR